MGGYTMDVPQTEKAVDMLNADAVHAQNADTDVSGMVKLPAPQAGTSIEPELAAFTSGWQQALGDIHTEMTGLASKIDTSKNVTIKVERQIGSHFDHFAR